jgi:CRP/FNR family transcriptional regulator, cyclic AMP receptor protein
MQTIREMVTENKAQAPSAGEFFSKLSPAALDDLKSMEHPSAYPAGMILFTEKQTPQGVYIIVSGAVKLSMNSSDGKRLIHRIARAGEILGLASAVSGKPSEITAETLHPAKIAVIERREFLGFLRRHPEVYQPVTEELSRHLNMVCEQLRTVGLSSSAPEKLARLLLDWSENGQTTDSGTRFHFPLTHEEIGEFIGTSRETVTRTLSAFRNRRLVSCHGTTLTIPSRMALENFARC